MPDLSPGSGRILLDFGAEHVVKCLLRELNVSDSFHFLLPLFLFRQDFHLRGRWSVYLVSIGQEWNAGGPVRTFRS